MQPPFFLQLHSLPSSSAIFNWFACSIFSLLLCMIDGIQRRQPNRICLIIVEVCWLSRYEMSRTNANMIKIVTISETPWILPQETQPFVFSSVHTLAYPFGRQSCEVCGMRHLCPIKNTSVFYYFSLFCYTVESLYSRHHWDPC